MDSPNIALVVGSSGIIGHAVTETLAAQPEWRLRALRRTLVPGVTTVDCDLNDAAATATALRLAADTTHVFYAAYRPEPDPQQTALVNTAMLRNVIDGLRAAGAPLRRVVHFQGVKAYGVHLGPPSTPFYEDDPRHLAINFYQQQEDLLRERSLHGQFSWTALRPDAIVGDIAGNPMNIALVLGVYAALSRDAGLPLRFPGSLHTYRNVLAELTDARWLARASLWAALAPAARNEIFNLAGAPFRWERMWRKLGAGLGMEVADPQPMSLSAQMPHMAGAWQRLSRVHGLQDIPYEQLVHWGFGDAMLNMQWDMVSDVGKIRRAGFTEAISTEDALIDAIRRLQRHGYLPRA
jgi:nucleoside-diphosphate-sugar epimerase